MEVTCGFSANRDPSGSWSAVARGWPRVSLCGNFTSSPQEPNPIGDQIGCKRASVIVPGDLTPGVQLWTLHKMLTATMAGSKTRSPGKSRPGQVNSTPRPARPDRLTTVSVSGRQKNGEAVPELGGPVALPALEREPKNRLVARQGGRSQRGEHRTVHRQRTSTQR